MAPQSRADASSQAKFPDLERLLIRRCSVISGVQRRWYSIVPQTQTDAHKHTEAKQHIVAFDLSWVDLGWIAQGTGKTSQVHYLTMKG